MPADPILSLSNDWAWVDDQFTLRNLVIFDINVEAFEPLQVLNPTLWMNGSCWSSCLSSTTTSRQIPSRPQMWTEAAGQTVPQTARERSAPKVSPSCWLAQPARTVRCRCWRNAESSWSFLLTPSWCVSCWGSQRRGRGGVSLVILKLSYRMSKVMI